MRWKNFGLQFRSSSATTAKFSVTRLKTVGQNKNASSAVRTTLIKDARKEKQENLSAKTVRDHMLHHTNGVRNTRNRHSGNM